MTPHAYKGPKYPDPAATAGLRQRLQEKRNAAIGRTTLLPLCSFPQVPDKKAPK